MYNHNILLKVVNASILLVHFISMYCYLEILVTVLFSINGNFGANLLK